MGSQATTAPTAASQPMNDAHLLVMRVADEALAFRLEAVAEIIRFPVLAHMPLAPRSLLGLANLRGVVLPVVSVRSLLGYPDAPRTESSRIVVTGDAAPVGFAVDAVEALADVPGDQIVQDRAGAGRLDPELLDGIVKGAEGATTIKIADPERILRGQFDTIGASNTAPSAKAPAAISGGTSGPTEAQRQTALVSFHLGAQEYALPLERVREIVPLPPSVSEIAGSESAVIGVVTLRDGLLPLVSLRVLLGLVPRTDGAEHGKVIVVSMGKSSVGVVADRTREILRVDPASVDPAPALLTRGGGEAEVESICRLDGGKRLVAILSPDRLFRSELVRRVLSETDNGQARDIAAEHNMTVAQFIVFRLGAQEYALPLADVDEVTRVPERITHMPKAPAFIEGVINLRGAVLPIVDLRRRFELETSESGRNRRIVVLSLEGMRAGFIVDAVLEILKVSGDAIQPAPEVSKEQMRLISRVVNLKEEARIILLIDPAQLLAADEAAAVMALARVQAPQTLTAS